MKEFNWLGGCTSCNVNCCHNEDNTIPENECTRPYAKKRYVTYSKRDKPADSMNNISINQSEIKESYDNRPLECRLFPFDVKEVDQKLVWVKWNQCHATPKLDYEKFMGFFERSFSRAIPLEEIKKYVTQRRLDGPESPPTDNYIVIREVNWPSM